VLSLWDGGGGASKVTLQVAPEDLYQQARDFDSAANMVDRRLDRTKLISALMRPARTWSVRRQPSG